MLATDLQRAVAAARAIVSDLGLPVDEATVLNDSNRIAVRLQPCDVLARVAHVGTVTAQIEVDLARRLAGTGCPVAPLDPRVEPVVYEQDGFVVTLWTHEAHDPRGAGPADYARALEQLHEGYRDLDLPMPRYSDRVRQALDIVEEPDISPELEADDRELLSEALRRHQQAVDERIGDGQLLHGEPHPGNVLSTSEGPRFIDLETCCRGPVEFDLAHVPAEVSDRYPNLDHELLTECRGLVLAMVAAWRWDRDDQLPNGRQAGLDLLAAVRAGPPWVTLTDLMPPA